LPEKWECTCFASGEYLTQFSPFPVRLENPHVIDEKQAFVHVIPRGPNSVALNSSFKTREDPRYLQDLGELILQAARSIPDGLLVFFPSYGVMEHSIAAWKNSSFGTSVWDRLKLVKEPMVEPKNKSDFTTAINSFYTKVDDETKVGAVFFAVCRGKVSEGVDFADTKGRAVIITGLPFPAAKDPKVMLKREYLDKAFRTDKTLQSGEVWYKQQAARAVNQAIGRVIRHRNDFGAILLCDERFNGEAAMRQLPVWVRPFVKTSKDFKDMNSSLHNFFQQMLKTMPVPVKRIELEKPPVNNNTINQGLVVRSTIGKQLGMSLPTQSSIAQKARMTNSVMNPLTRHSLEKSDALEKSENGVPKREAPEELQRESVKKPKSEAGKHMQLVRTVLSKADFQLWQSMLRQYKSKDTTLQKLVEVVIDLFVRKYSVVQVAKDFSIFLPTKHQREFSELLEKGISACK
jgi:hypothetical protein